MKHKTNNIARLVTMTVLFVSIAAVVYVVATRMSALDVRQDQLRGLIGQTDRRLDDSIVEVQKLRWLIERLNERLDDSIVEVQKLREYSCAKKVDLYLRPAVAIGTVSKERGIRLIGSGVVVKSIANEDKDEFTNFILTAYHVINGEPTLAVVVYNYDNGTCQEYEAQVEATDSSADLALVSCATPLELHTARVTSTTPTLFQPVVVTGVRATSGLPISTNGYVVKNFHGAQEGEWYVNAPVIYGCSGGPVFDAASGEIIGIVVRAFVMRGQFVEHVGVVVPAPVVRGFLTKVLG